MKSSDIWVLLILTTLPQKPPELEGMWRSCVGTEKRDFEYVAEFKKDELIEDYFSRMPENGACGGKRIFHFRRISRLSFNNFKFTTHLPGDRPRFQSEFSYKIQGETLRIVKKGNVVYLKRVEYPNFFKIKEFLLGVLYSKSIYHKN